MFLVARAGAERYSRYQDVCWPRSVKDELEGSRQRAINPGIQGEGVVRVAQTGFMFFHKITLGEPGQLWMQVRNSWHKRSLAALGQRLAC